jgi:acylphosphatase
VFFRESTKRQALALGVTGWTANLPDGSVTVVAEGPPAEMETFVAYCRQGPPLSVVNEVEVEDSPATGEFSTFEVRR